MADLERFKEMIREFASVADFVLIYVREAHPLDGWNVRGPKYEDMLQHKSLEERIEAAKLLRKEGIDCPILVDTMDNKTCLAYGAFPERYYIIHNRKVVLANGLGPQCYSPQDVKGWLEVNQKTM